MAFVGMPLYWEQLDSGGNVADYIHFDEFGCVLGNVVLGRRESVRTKILLADNEEYDPHEGRVSLTRIGDILVPVFVERPQPEQVQYLLKRWYDLAGEWGLLYAAVAGTVFVIKARLHSAGFVGQVNLKATKARVNLVFDPLHQWSEVA